MVVLQLVIYASLVLGSFRLEPCSSLQLLSGRRSPSRMGSRAALTQMNSYDAIVDVFSPPAQAAIASLAQWPQLTFAPGDVDGTLGSLLLSDESTGTIGYSNLSLYFTLALYLLTLPGLFSLVTRSVKVKTTRKTFDIPGPANPTAKPLRQVAAEVMAYFKALNYEVSAAEDVITFKGVMGRSNSQAYFLTFCTFVGLGSLALVVSILLPDVGSKAYAITLLSPYAGIYYWNNAQRVDEVSVKMETSDDEQLTTIVAQGGKEDLERFSETLKLVERGKVYVKGIFESGDSDGSSGYAMMESKEAQQ